MIKRYQSNYSNEVHQLIVSPSKHYYVTRSGVFKFQKKPFESKLKNANQTNKIEVLHYLVRDHFSGLFYWEICSAESPIPIYEFLYRAWSKKENHPLYGIPDFMTVPKNVNSFFPGLIDFIEKLGITFIKVTSGFQGGVRDIRTIESELKWAGFDIMNPHQSLKELPFTMVLEKSSEICSRFYGNLYKNPSKQDIWLSGLKPQDKILVPIDLQKIKELYQDTQHHSAVGDREDHAAPKQ